MAYKLIDLQTGQEVGFGDMAVRTLAALDTRTRTWTQHINATMMIAEDTAALGTVAFATANCSGGCTATTSTDKPLPLNVAVDFGYQVSSDGSAVNHRAVQPVLTRDTLPPAPVRWSWPWGKLRGHLPVEGQNTSFTSGEGMLRSQ